MTNKNTEEVIFADCKPFPLENIDWASLDHRRIVASSLVNAVYLHEQDRHVKKRNGEPKAPVWWESFHFRHYKDLKEHYLHSNTIFGSIFEYKPPNDDICQNPSIPFHARPPKYVIAFRGTLLKRPTILTDLCLDAALVLNVKTRYKASLEPVQNIIDEVGEENIWLAGHSLGAAIALQVGKTMAKNGCYIGTYLFNPPNCSIPIEILPIRKLKTVVRIAQDVVTAGASVALRAVMKKNQDFFTKLGPWIPYLFVNQKDPISCEYIGYFEHREKMVSRGFRKTQRFIAKHSVLSIASSVYGKGEEALHQIPTTFLVKNCEAKNALDAHGIDQWWKPHLDLQTSFHSFNSQIDV